MAEKHQLLTVVYALLTVEAGERSDGLVTCEPPGRRCSGMDTHASPRLRQAPWQNGASTKERESRRAQGYEQ